MTINSTHPLHAENPPIPTEKEQIIPLNGKSYYLKIYYKESTSVQEEEITIVL